MVGPIAVGDIGSIELGEGETGVGGPGSRSVGVGGAELLPTPSVKQSPELCTVHTRDSSVCPRTL